jgi:hypothetical protein
MISHETKERVQEEFQSMLKAWGLKWKVYDRGLQGKRLKRKGGVPGGWRIIFSSEAHLDPIVSMRFLLQSPYHFLGLLGLRVWDVQKHVQANLIQAFQAY